MYICRFLILCGFLDWSFNPSIPYASYRLFHLYHVSLDTPNAIQTPDIVLRERSGLIIILYLSVVVSIKDTGSGIDPQILPRLFTKFTTRSKRGTGLGLYICKRIIEAHGGKIWGENNVDQGATFSFSLPADLTLR